MGDLAAEHIEKYFGHETQHGPSIGIIKWVLKKAAKTFLPKVLKAAQSEEASISWGGKTMTGADFRAWREQLRKPKQHFFEGEPVDREL